MSLLFNMLSRLVIAFLSRSKHLLISWLQSLSAVILEPPRWTTINLNFDIRANFCNFSVNHIPKFTSWDTFWKGVFALKLFILHQNSLTISYKRKSVNYQLCFIFWYFTCDLNQKWLKCFYFFVSAWNGHFSQRYLILDQWNQVILFLRILSI